MKIISLIKRKKLGELTSDPYNPVDSVDSTYIDLEQIAHEDLLRK